MISVETKLPTWVVATRRAGAEYRTRIERLDPPRTGTPKERVAAFMSAEVAAFERIIADAPEQWWTLFFPIWDDIKGTDA